MTKDLAEEKGIGAIEMYKMMEERIAELKQFHEFKGFPFDQACDGHEEEGEMLLQ